MFDDPTTGAHDDIDRATEIARRMVTEFGMSDLLGPIRFVGPNEEVFVGRDMGHAPEYSQSVAARIDDEIRRLVDGAHTAARTILETHRDELEAALRRRCGSGNRSTRPKSRNCSRASPKWHGERHPASRPAAVASSEPPRRVDRSPR